MAGRVQSQRARRAWRTAIAAGMASYLDAGAIVTTGIALVLSHRRSASVTAPSERSRAC